MKKIFLLTLIAFAFKVSAQMPNTISAEQKVYGLSKFWQEVNYNFVYLNRVDRKAWDSLYVSMIPRVQQTKNDYEYYHEMQRFCAFLKDGHTNVNFPIPISTLILNSMFGDYRLFVANVDGKAIVTRTNLSKKTQIPIGSEIITVNGLPTKEYIRQYVMPYIASSTDYVREDNSYSLLLQGVTGQKFDLKLRTTNGNYINLSLTHNRTTEKEVFPAFPETKLLDFKWYPEQVAYVALNSFGDEKIDSLFIAQLPELYRAKKLIIDLRENGGGSTNIGVEILKYLTNDTIIYGSATATRLHESAYKAWGKYVNAKDTTNRAFNKKAYLDFTDNRYATINDAIKFENDIKVKKIIIPTVILIGHNTASAAEDFLISADNQKHMIKIGENSFGSTGQPFLFDLPGGGSARVCSKKDTYADGREFVGFGVKPDIEVKKTLQDFIKNNDPALNKALAYLHSKNSRLLPVKEASK